MYLKPYALQYIILHDVGERQERKMKNINQIIGNLPAKRRAKVTARAQQLIGEEMALQHVRKARHLTQEQMAKALNIGQDSISRLESRSDLLISTLQSYIEAMGGSLKLVVEFPDGRAVLSSLGETGGERRKPVPRAKKLAVAAR
jgi:transcriptional regulator with XRE-family HTH domain